MTPTAKPSQAQAKATHRTLENRVFLTFLVCALLLVSTQVAYAQTGSPMADVLCDIIGMIYGNLGRGLCTLAVVIIGVGATLGKTSWSLAMTVAIGVAIVFNAGYIVSLLIPNSVGC